MLKFLIVLIALVGLNQIEANVFVFGSCAKSPVIADFDITKYVGKWYEIQHIPAPFEPNLRCTTAVYTQQNATQIKVDNQGISVDGKVTAIEGKAWVKDLKAPNQLALQFTNIPTGSYNVWETDYTSYTLIYSCTQIVPYVLKSELIYILSRATTLDQAVQDRLVTLLAQNGSGSNSQLLKTDQANC